MNKNTEIVEIPKSEFEALIHKLKICQENNKKLQEAIDFLNKQIANYNKSTHSIKS